LIGFSLTAARLKVEDFLDIGPGPDVMIATNAFLEP